MVCDEPLQSLGKRLDVARVVGVKPLENGAATGMEIEVSSGVASQWPPAKQAATVVELRPRFSALYLLPFGGGQFAQGRPIFGSVYAATEMGCLAWSVVAWQRDRKAQDRREYDREPALRERRNLTGWLFWGSLVAGMAEAVVVGLVTGE